MKMIVCIMFCLTMFGCGIQHSVYTNWKYDTNDEKQYKKENYECLQFSKIAYNSSYSRWNNTELIFIDMANDISKKNAAEEYYKCMDSHGWKIENQLVNTSGETIDEAEDAFAKCMKYQHNDNLAKKCFADSGWYLLEKEPWVYEYDDNDTVIAKVSGQVVPEGAEIDSKAIKHASQLVDASGTWKGSCSSSLTGLSTAILDLSQNGTEITGTYATNKGVTGIVSGSINGNEISYQIIPQNRGCSGSFAGKAVVRRSANIIPSIQYDYNGSSNCGGAEKGTGTLMLQ